MSAFLETTNLPAWLFVVLVGAGVAYLFRLDAQPGKFKLVQFVTDSDGRANSGSLAYVTALMVSTWALWYEAQNGRLSEWLFAAYIATFVAGGVWRSSIGAKERIAQINADKPPATPVTITETNTRETEVSNAG